MNTHALSEAEVDLTLSLIRSRMPSSSDVSFQLLAMRSARERAKAALTLFTKLSLEDRRIVEDAFGMLTADWDDDRK